MRSISAAVSPQAPAPTIATGTSGVPVGIRPDRTTAGVAAVVNRVGSMLTGFFTAGPVTDYASATASDTKRYARFFHTMLERGVYLAPSQFEAAFVSTAHDEKLIDRTIAAAREAMKEVASC